MAAPLSLSRWLGGASSLLPRQQFRVRNAETDQFRANPTESGASDSFAMNSTFG